WPTSQALKPCTTTPHDARSRGARLPAARGATVSPEEWFVNEMSVGRRFQSGIAGDVVAVEFGATGRRLRPVFGYVHDRQAPGADGHQLVRIDVQQDGEDRPHHAT